MTTPDLPDEPIAEPEAPPPAVDAPVSTPVDTTEAALQELAERHPIAGQFLALQTRAREVLGLCAGQWPEAEDAIRSLHYPAERFKKSLLRTVAAAALEQERPVRVAGRALADDLMNKIRAFDALLPGKSSEGPLPPRSPSQLPQADRETLGGHLRGLRDLVLAVMRDHGGYDEYPVALGDSLAKHGAALEEVTFVTTTRHRANVIFQILEPGYVRQRFGRENRSDSLRPGVRPCALSPLTIRRARAASSPAVSCVQWSC